MISAVIVPLVICALQAPSLPPTYPPLPKPSPIEKLDASTYAIGEMRVDTARKTLSVPGTVNDVSILEFMANTPGGMKAYESALTLRANAVSFNAAMMLIGVDPLRGKPSKMQFDPTPPSGDPVEIMVTFSVAGVARTMPIEDLAWDQRSKRTLPSGLWVYTGSTFLSDGRFLAELDGVLIGLMHGPQAIIDNAFDHAVGGYSSIVMNPNLGLKPGTPVTVTIRALKVP